jgi:hypothetical protein
VEHKSGIALEDQFILDVVYTMLDGYQLMFMKTQRYTRPTKGQSEGIGIQPIECLQDTYPAVCRLRNTSQNGRLPCIWLTDDKSMESSTLLLEYL